MAIECFVRVLREAASSGKGEPLFSELGPYHPRNTDSVHIAGANWIYSKESDLENIIAREQRARRNPEQDNK